jgi:hypothetical protein
VSRLSIILTIVGSLIVLTQWTSLTSIRKYVLGIDEPLKRRIAYPLLAVIGALNFMLIRLVFDTTVLDADSPTRQYVGIAYFSYLGLALGLSLFFAALAVTGGVWSLAETISRALRVSANPDRYSESRTANALQNLPPLSGDTRARLKDDTERGSLSPDRSPEAFLFESAPAPTQSCDSGAHCSRRSFLRWAGTAGVVGAFGAVGVGLAEAYNVPTVEEHIVQIPGLEGMSRDEIRIVQFTDFHLGLFCGPGELERLVEILNGIEADAVVMTGDIFHSSMTRIDSAVPILRGMRTRLLGNLGVLGNHDFYTGELESAVALDKSGMRVLRNEWVTYTEGSVRIHFGGIDDPMVNWLTGQKMPNFGSLMRKAPNEDGVSILLSHRPSALPYAAKAGIDLVLSGHTHGGQIVVPIPGSRGWSVARVVSDFTHGWYERGTSQLYVNRGAGMTFLPWRLNCPPEISLFRLRAPAEKASAAS